MSGTSPHWSKQRHTTHMTRNGVQERNRSQATPLQETSSHAITLQVFRRDANNKPCSKRKAASGRTHGAKAAHDRETATTDHTPLRQGIRRRQQTYNIHPYHPRKALNGKYTTINKGKWNPNNPARPATRRQANKQKNIICTASSFAGGSHCLVITIDIHELDCCNYLPE